MQRYPITIVDVFAERPLAGNQLAIVHDAADLSDDQMQAIARETNFSETTFVTAQDGASATVRIFTPAAELPFAGHPTVGTAWALTEGQGDIELQLKAGPVRVTHDQGIGWMTPPDVRFTGTLNAQQAAQLVGLEPDDFMEDLPIELAEVGPQFVLLPLKNLASLRRMTVNAELRRNLLADGVAVRSLFAFTPEAYEPAADFASRMFFDVNGIREDPATGSANTAFAAYLRQHRGNLGDVVVDQGVEMQRPSRLYLKVEEVIQVGGKTQPVVRGELSV